METPSTSPDRNKSKGLPPSPASVAIGNPDKKQQKPQTEGQVIADDDRKKRTNNELNQHTAQEMRLLSAIIADVDSIVRSPRSKTEEVHTVKPSLSVSASTVSERADNGMTRSLADEIADNVEDKAYELIPSRSGVEVPIDSTSFPLAPPPPPKSKEAPTCPEEPSISGSASPGRSKKSPSPFVRAKRSFFSRLSKPQASLVDQSPEEYNVEPPPAEAEKPAVPEKTDTSGPPSYLNPMLIAFAANDRLDEAADEVEEGVAGKKKKRSKAKMTQKTKLRKGASKLGKNKSKGLSTSRHPSKNASMAEDASVFETLWTLFTTTCS